MQRNIAAMAASLSSIITRSRIREVSPWFLRFPLIVLAICLLGLPLFGQSQSAAKAKPRVVVVGVNGMELDVIRPLLLKGEMPNLARVIKNGAYGKLRTV